MPVFYEDSLGDWMARGLTEGSSADDELIEDRAAFEAAQAAVNDRPDEQPKAADWEVVAGPIVFSVGTEFPGVLAAQITMPLDDAEIAYAWDPYPPAEMPLALEPTGQLASHKFMLLTSPEDANVARALLEDSPAGPVPPAAPAPPAAPVQPTARVAPTPPPVSHVVPHLEEFPHSASAPMPSAPFDPVVDPPDHPFLRAALIGVALSAIVAAVYYGYGALR